MEKQKNAVGRRKEAVARVYLSKGTGNITVNDKEYKAYFPIMYLQNQVELPLKTLDLQTSFDIVVNVAGGGPKKEGLITRDSRSVERKKFGKAKARRSFQFSKR
jgi:small subunit ribosomal protein S9